MAPKEIIRLNPIRTYIRTRKSFTYIHENLVRTKSELEIILTKRIK